VEKDVQIRHPVKRPRRAAAGTRAGIGPDLLASHRLYFADEALSVVRHDVLNRMTAVGALSFELRRAFEDGHADDGRNRSREVVVQARLADLNRQLASITTAVSRRLAPPMGSQPSSALVDEAAQAVLALSLWPVAVAVSRGKPRPRLAVAMAPRELAVILMCALDNAVEASQGRRKPAVELGWQPRPEGDVAVTIQDNGPGFAADVEEQAFERFFTTKPGHPGLGLSVIRSVLLRRGGHAQLENRGRDAGARVTMIIPAAVGARPRARRGRAKA
jgi:C4-dicarboxylate-specific signal transduction histidine kinase